MKITKKEQEHIDFLREIQREHNLVKGDIFDSGDGTLYNKTLEIKCDTIAEFIEKKWSSKTPNGWYGFGGIRINSIKCLLVLDKVTDYLNNRVDDFEIQQIKIKFGGLRYYTNAGSEFYSMISELENIIFDNIVSSRW